MNILASACGLAPQVLACLMDASSSHSNLWYFSYNNMPWQVLKTCLMKDEKLVAWRLGSWAGACFRKLEKSCGCFWRPTAALPAAECKLSLSSEQCNVCSGLEHSPAMVAAAACFTSDVSEKLTCWGACSDIKPDLAASVHCN